MGGVRTGTTAGTTRTAGAREISVVEAATTEDYPSGIGAIINVEARVAGNFLAGPGATAF